ncbi:hypothetical protein ACLOJK_018903 [Asimina triloba]
MSKCTAGAPKFGAPSSPSGCRPTHFRRGSDQSIGAVQKIRHEEMINRGQRSIKQPFIASDREQMETSSTSSLLYNASQPSAHQQRRHVQLQQIQPPPITSRCLDPTASHNRTHHQGRLHVSVQHQAARRPAVRTARPFCISPIRRHLTMASNMSGSMSESIFPNNPPGSQQQIRGSLKPIPSNARSRPHGTTATISTASSARYDFYKRPQWDRSELGST